jgi:hypothetical protein
MNHQAPFYRLRQLIIEKYGEDKFETGCELVARWVTHELRLEVNVHDVKCICDYVDRPVESEVCTSLMHLFKLNSAKELHTIPETTPACFN